MANPVIQEEQSVEVMMADGSVTRHTYTTPDELEQILDLQRQQLRASRVAKRKATKRMTQTLNAYTDSMEMHALPDGPNGKK